MFKHKIKIILKSGYEIKIRAKDIKFETNNGFINPSFKKPNLEIMPIDYSEIAAVTVKKWWQRW